MEDNKEEIKEEVKRPEGVMAEDQVATPDTTPTPTEATADTQPASDVPNLNSDVEPTPEQKAEDPELANGEGSENVEEQIERMLTQSQVNELIGNTRKETRDKTRNEVMAEIYNRYGVNDDEELNNIFGRGQAYDVLSEDFTNQGNQLRQALAENALLKSGIAQSRWDDAKAILTAKGMDITQENIISELQTHPEWLGNVQTAQSVQADGMTKPLDPQTAEQFAAKPAKPMEAPSVIRKMGSEVQSMPNDMSEDDQINKWFGLNK